MSKNPDLFNNPRFITSPLHKVHASCNIRSVSSSRCRFKEKRNEGEVLLHLSPLPEKFDIGTAQDAATILGWWLSSGRSELF